ncbi:MAG: cytochrome c oxidase assembly protein [Acidobacteriaceae bacterium]
MSPAMQSVFDEWSLPIWLTLAIALTALLYLRGWFAIRRTRPEQFETWRLVCFMLGMAVLWISIGSPLDAFADILLSAHMVEHLLLMSVVPPLVLLGLPVVPLLRGLPVIARKAVIGPLLRLSPLRRLGHWLVLPAVAWLAMNLSFLAWHVPAAYDFALEHEGWHDFEHLCFLGTSILFWWCIVQPWPSRQQQQSWGVLLYLIGADLVNTGLSAFLAFCNRPVYPFYVEHPNPFQIDPLSDQVLGAAVMWVFGSTVFLLPVIYLTMKLAQPSRVRRVTALQR